MKGAKTIDEKHKEITEQFQKNINEVIPNLENEIRTLTEKLESTKKTTNIEEFLNIKEKIKFKKREIKRIINYEKNYYLENSKNIFTYFEHNKSISVGGGNSSILNKFFKVATVNDSENHIDRYNRARFVYQNYWKNVSNDYINIQDYIVHSDNCDSCNIGELIPQDDEGILICNNKSCGKFITYIVDSNKPNNKEPPNEVSYTAYIRLNHFKEILSQFQAKETTQIPDDVIQKIRDRIKKERIKDYKEINYDKMREILRKLGLNKYFEHIQFINSMLGVKPPIMNEELHETLCVLFIEIQKPWAVHCPPNRTNFFNYTYTLHQLCVLLDQTQYLPYIPMMKDREKQLEQDMIWKKVCNDLDWEYFPTV